MKPQKAFVRQDNSTVIKCPNCLKAKIISAVKFKGQTKTIKVKCYCQTVFPVFFEFRKTYRKETNLKGTYIDLTLNNECFDMIVKNVSLTGLGFNTIGKHRIEKGHELEVQFAVTSPLDTIIHERAVAKVIKGNFVGCEFIGSKELNRSLGFYLLP
jgi:hypothetical protein